ncbi:hypothetical protein nbrc107696_08240 [Gordonia spumicola]|uniref:Secreted protein n=1 Tax=Gordonia spumicola TaxID=589161 RepID=A0A7I9V4N8_9ACTN|nr:hypothetical protein [Gordonia spumicola]GEE00378.1 hypothetical protein nbrc107696_08240 [Gordonia spumicola]
MSITLKRAVAGAALAAAGLAGTLGVGALTAAPAEAKVESGRYTMTTDTFGMKSSGRAVVRGNKLFVSGATLHLHQTRNGAYADFGVNRYIFVKKGENYVGKVVMGPVTISGVKLIKR